MCSVSPEQEQELSEIVDELKLRARDVAARYLGEDLERNGKVWARNPWRDDLHANSFYVNTSGPYQGWFYDHSTGEKGDTLDLIQNALRLSKREAIEEARVFLGRGSETPAQKRAREDQNKRLRAERERRDRQQKEDQAAAGRRAQGLWIGAQAEWGDTPAGHYLAARGITADRLGRLPRVIRFAPSVRIQQHDVETGEVFEGSYPAMVTAAHGPAIEGKAPEFYTVQLHYLQHFPDPRFWSEQLPDKIMSPDPAKRWWKAAIPMPKKYYYGAPKQGAFVRAWSGEGASAGSKGAPLARASGEIFMSEGIEDALSAAVLDPRRRVIAALDLENMSEVVLPRAITSVTIIADNDPKPDQVQLMERAAARLREQGRAVTVWRNAHGGKDLNDALLLALKEGAD